MNAAEFAAVRADLPDGGRWTELVEGRPVGLAPPEPLHGTFVLNLSNAVAAAVLRNAKAGRVGAGAVGELGLQTAADPDTVRFPAVSLFAAGVFSQVDKPVADATPPVVVEVPGTPDRRRDLPRRVEEYHAAGVGEVSVADIREKTVSVAAPHEPPAVLAEADRLTTALLPGFAPTVAELFTLPEWWTRDVRAKAA